MLNSFILDTFNKHDVHLNILVYEFDKINIYSDLEGSAIVATTAELNFKIYEVLELIEKDKSYILKIKVRNSIIGYLKPNTSLLMLPKLQQQSKIKNLVSFKNPLNEFLNLRDVIFKENRNKISFSSYYTIFKNEIYEAVVLKHDIVGFFKPEELNKVEKSDENFRIIKETITYYDSELTKKGKKIKVSDNIYKAKYIIIDEKVLKFKYQGKDYWIDMDCLDIKLNSKVIHPRNVNEAIIDSMLYQYQNKLSNSHKYYLKILNKEIRSMENKK